MNVIDFTWGVIAGSAVTSVIYAVIAYRAVTSPRSDKEPTP